MREIAGTMAVLYPLMFGTVQKDCEEDDIGGEVEKEGKSWKTQVLHTNGLNSRLVWLRELWAQPQPEWPGSEDGVQGKLLRPKDLSGMSFGYGNLYTLLLDKSIMKIFSTWLLNSARFSFFPLADLQSLVKHSSVTLRAARQEPDLVPL